MSKINVDDDDGKDKRTFFRSWNKREAVDVEDEDDPVEFSVGEDEGRIVVDVVVTGIDVVPSVIDDREEYTTVEFTR